METKTEKDKVSVEVENSHIVRIPIGKEREYYLANTDEDQRLLDDEFIKWMKFAVENDIDVMVERSDGSYIPMRIRVTGE